MRFQVYLYKRAAVIAAALFALCASLGIGYAILRGPSDDARYAADLFDGLLPYEPVVASWYWGTFGAWSCTYGIVALGDRTPKIPPSRDRTAMGWRYAWGGDWTSTPAPSLGDSTRDAVGACALEWPAENRTAVATCA